MGGVLFGHGLCPGTFGELLQGILPGEKNNFLVTLPIERYSTARFYADSSSRTLSVDPPHKFKSIGLARQILEHYGLQMGGLLHIQSDLPEGKGLSSSSADLVATARAISSAVSRVLSNELLLRFLRDIEPTDGVMYADCTLFYHLRVVYGRALGRLPPLKIVALDEGGMVDTKEYNRKLPPFSESLKLSYQISLERLQRAFRQQDLKSLGDITTESAILNQRFNPKKHLHQVIEICGNQGGIGTVVAHSGTYVGIMLNKLERDYADKLAAVEREVRKLGNDVYLLDSIHPSSSAEDLRSGHQRAGAADPPQPGATGV